MPIPVATPAIKSIINRVASLFFMKIVKIYLKTA